MSPYQCNTKVRLKLRTNLSLFYVLGMVKFLYNVTLPIPTNRQWFCFVPLIQKQ